MSFDMNLEQFLSEAGYTQKQWEQSGLCWENLKSIANRHEVAIATLSLHGGTIANRMQAFYGVHSVRWRIKDTYGLLKKILRKNLETPKNIKWETINENNYRSVTSDLIGVRALHLLKESCVVIDQQIRDTWNVHDITIFKRDGDEQLSEIIEKGASEKLHPYGYRSIHYDLSYQPEKEAILVEVQVRTIFQEAWSEVDHKVKYPDYSDNELLAYFLKLFNGLSGTADEMASFVIKLSNLIGDHSATTLENELTLQARDSDIEKLQAEIDKLRTAGKVPSSAIESLQTSVDNIKEAAVTKHNNWQLARTLAFSTASPLFEKNAEIIRRMLGDDPRWAATLRGLGAPSVELRESLDRIIQPHAELVKKMTPAADIVSSIARGLQPNINLTDAIISQDFARNALSRPSEDSQPPANSDEIEDEDKS